MNNKGQFTIEAILLMVLFMGIVALVGGYFNKQGVLASLVKGPWVGLSGMLENGEWRPPQQGQALHPSQHGRHVTIDGVSGTGGGGGTFQNPPIGSVSTGPNYYLNPGFGQ